MAPYPLGGTRAHSRLVSGERPGYPFGYVTTAPPSSRRSWAVRSSNARCQPPRVTRFAGPLLLALVASPSASAQPAAAPTPAASPVAPSDSPPVPPQSAAPRNDVVPPQLVTFVEATYPSEAQAQGLTADVLLRLRVE